MREHKWFILTCFLLAVIAAIQLNSSRDDSSIFDGVPLLVCSVIATILFIVAFFHFFRCNYLPTTKRLIPFCFWAASVAAVAVYSRWLNRIERIPNFMHVSSGSDFSIDGFTLKEDGQYIYWNGSGFGESRNYGTYVQKDSVISLYPTSHRNTPRQMQLVIRPFSLGVTPAFSQISRVYLIDKNGKTLAFDSGYNIVELAGR